MDAGDICPVILEPDAGNASGPGERLGIILQSAWVTGLPTVLVVPLVTDVRALCFPGTVAVEPDPDNRLARSHAALLFQLTAVDTGRVGAPRGRVASAVLTALRSELDRLTGNPRHGAPAAAG